LELLNLARKHDIPRASKVFHSLTSASLTPLGDSTHAYFEMLASNNRMDQAQASFQILYQIEQNALHPPIKLARHRYFLCNSYLAACCTASDLGRGLHLYTLMKQDLGQLPDLKTVTRLFTLLSKKSTTQAHFSDSLSWMIQILDDLQKNQIQPYPLLFNLTLSQATSQSALESTEYNKRLELLNIAQRVFDQMIQSGVVPTAVTYCTLIKGDLAFGFVQRAESRFYEMISHQEMSWTDDSIQIKPHPKKRTGRQAQFMNSMGPFNALIQFYIQKTHQFQKARDIFDLYEAQCSHLILPTGFTFYLLITGITATFSKRNLSESLNLIQLYLNKMSRYQLKPNLSHVQSVFEVLIQYQEWDCAKHWMQYVHSEFQIELKGEYLDSLVQQVLIHTNLGASK
jgi:hypothetical protein